MVTTTPCFDALCVTFRTSLWALQFFLQFFGQQKHLIGWNLWQQKHLICRAGKEKIPSPRAFRSSALVPQRPCGPPFMVAQNERTREGVKAAC